MTHTIGDLAKATDTKVETIRYYERIGLLAKPPRTSGNYRSYGPAELARLSFIRRSRDLGFSLDQIRALLALSDDRNRDCSGIDDIANVHLRGSVANMGHGRAASPSWGIRQHWRNAY
jgi:DNA-binding transcriptional MerR regulator